MGRAIEVDKRLDSLEYKVNEILLILDDLSNMNTTQEHIDLHEETKEQKTDDEGNGDSDVKPDNGVKKKSTGNNKNSKSSKWFYRIQKRNRTIHKICGGEICRTR